MDTASQERLQETLSALLIQINALQTLVDEPIAQVEQIDLPTLRDGLHTVEQMTHDALYAVRISCMQETLPELEGVTLAEALSRLVEETAETLHLSSRLSFSGTDEQGRPREQTLSSIAERTLFQIAREMLYDVRHHSGARTIRFALIYGQDDVQMNIEDDGKFIDTESASEQNRQDILPFINTNETATTRSQCTVFTDLRYRIEQLGGSLQHEPRAERGTRVLARLPYTQHIPLRQPSLPMTPTLITNIAQQDPVRILIVDGQAVTRAGLRRLLESYADLRVIGEASDGVQAVSETLELGPQVVLLDAQLPNGQSLEALRQIKQLQLDTHVLLLSAQDREEYLYETLRAGADGYVLKDIAPDELAQALRSVAHGETLVQSQLAGRLLSRIGKQGRDTAFAALTARELEVLHLLARGLRNKEIADRLYISERTVNFHLANIYQKLNVSGRTEALSRALKEGLISA